MQGCYITEAIQGQKIASGEEDNYRRADGLSIPVEVTATPLVEDGRAIGAVVVFRDVTQRREVDRMKSEFVSMVSHELRTPLTAIRGSLGLIAGGALGEVSPSAAHMVDIALVSSERLTRLINQILDIERIESGMQPMELGDPSSQGPGRVGGRPGAGDRRGSGSTRQCRPHRGSGLRRRGPGGPDAAQSAGQCDQVLPSRWLGSRSAAGHAAPSSSSPSETTAEGSRRTSWTASSPVSSRWTPPMPARRGVPD